MTSIQSTTQDQNPNNTESITITTSQISKLMKVSERTVHRWRRNDPTFPAAMSLPETKSARFDVELINRWINEEVGDAREIKGFLRFESPMLTIADICAALNISKKTFHNRIKGDKLFPKAKIVKNSNIVRYKTIEIHQWYLSIHSTH